MRQLKVNAEYQFHTLVYFIDAVISICVLNNNKKEESKNCFFTTMKHILDYWQAGRFSIRSCLCNLTNMQLDSEMAVFKLLFAQDQSCLTSATFLEFTQSVQANANKLTSRISV